MRRASLLAVFLLSCASPQGAVFVTVLSQRGTEVRDVMTLAVTITNSAKAPATPLAVERKDHASFDLTETQGFSFTLLFDAGQSGDMEIGVQAIGRGPKVVGMAKVTPGTTTPLEIRLPGAPIGSDMSVQDYGRLPDRAIPDADLPDSPPLSMDQAPPDWLWSWPDTTWSWPDTAWSWPDTAWSWPDTAWSWPDMSGWPPTDMTRDLSNSSCAQDPPGFFCPSMPFCVRKFFWPVHQCFGIAFSDSCTTANSFNGSTVCWSNGAKAHFYFGSNTNAQWMNANTVTTCMSGTTMFIPMGQPPKFQLSNPSGMCSGVEYDMATRQVSCDGIHANISDCWEIQRILTEPSSLMCPPSAQCF